MTFSRTAHIRLSLCTVTLLSCAAAASADPMAFGFKSEDRVYSTEKADGSYYGDTMGGLMTESSTLRMEAQRDLQKGNLDEAIRKARKAVQYDTECTESHLILARALTAKLYQSDFEEPDSLHAECIHEWRLLRWHSPDTTEQSEAGRELIKLKMNRFTAAHRRKRREQEVQAIVLGRSKTK